MTAKAKKNIKETTVLSALKLAADIGWAEIKLADIAKAAKIKLVDVRDYFDDKGDILTAFGRMIDKQVMEALPEFDEDVPVRERLFDILMERFDALNAYRGGVVSVISSFKCDPKQAVISLPHLCKSMSWMLEAAGVNTSGVAGAARVAGMSGLYLRVLYVWAGDDSADMAKTMAALDRGLGFIDAWAERLGLGSGG